MDKIKTVKIKNIDGSISEETYTISVDAKDVDMANNKDLQDTIGVINVDEEGSVAEQLAKLDSDKINITDIIDNLNSTQTDKVLSANQGKMLGDAVAALEAESIKKKAYFFDTVADMKADTKLKVGDMVITLGYHSKSDEGSALYKIRNITNNDVVDEMLIIELVDDNLVAEYINENGVISLEQMGAYGDNIHDDSNVINKALLIANSKKYNVIGNKYYLINNTINIVYNELNIKLNKINYIGVENAIYLNGKRNNLTINKIVSSGVGLYITCNDDSVTQKNTININTINSTKHGVYFYTDTWGIFEIYLTFREIFISDNTYCGIYLKATTSQTHSTTYINQIIIYGGRIDGALYSLYADASNGQINELLTYNISGESSTNGIYLNQVTDSSFENWRLEELTNEAGHLYMKLVGSCGNNNFRFNRYAPIELIDRTELTNGGGTPNTIYSNIRDTRQGVCIGTIMKFHGPTELEIISPRLSYSSKTIKDDTTLGDLEFVKFFNISANATSTTPTIILNGMYGDDGINTFYVFKRSNTDSVTVKTADESNSVTITRNGLNQITIIGGLLLLQ